MKKSVFRTAVVALLILPVFASAQGMYVDVNLGWAFPFNTQTGLVSNVTSTNYNDFDNSEYAYTSTEEAVALSLGKGISFGAGFGYLFNQYLGAELQLSYLVGGKTSGDYSDQTTYISGGITDKTTITNTTTFSATMFRVVPTFVLKAGTEKINPYAKLGVVIGFGTIEVTDIGNFGGTMMSYKGELNGGVSFGLNTRLGVEFGATGKLTYFAELNIMSLNYAPKKGELFEYKVDGVEMLGDLTTSEREIEFVDVLTFQEDAPDDQPTQELKMNMPFSGIGVNVGIRIAL